MLTFHKRYLGWMITVGLLIVLGACSDDVQKAAEAKMMDVKAYEPAPDPYVSQISTYDDERLDEQEEVEMALWDEYEQDTYTVDDPFIKVDPYDASPLSALVMFETEEPVKVKVTTGSGDVPIVRTWDELETSHAIPVLGLYPDQDNKVTIEITDRKS